MSTWMESFKQYFDVRNRAWVTGKATDLQKFSGSKAHVVGGRNVVFEELACKRRAMRERQSKVLRAHTKTDLQSMKQNAEGTRVYALVQETVTLVYRDGSDYGVESRVCVHQQAWKLRESQWILTSSKISTETRADDSVHATLRFGTRGHPSTPIRNPIRNYTYDRVQAIRYADLWWNGYNPVYPQLADDCTNFISQCLFAGHLAMTGGQDRATGWWYRFKDDDSTEPWSYSFTVSHALYRYLTKTCGGEVLESARELKMGDIIFYDWDGTGRFHHTTIVTDFDAQGDPLVNAHTDASFHRHYRYTDSRAWTPQTRYAFIHLPDKL